MLHLSYLNCHLSPELPFLPVSIKPDWFSKQDQQVTAHKSQMQLWNICEVFRVKNTKLMFIAVLPTEVRGKYL